MRRLARLVAAAGLVLAGGLALPGGAAQAAACSGSTGVTVVIDYGSSSTTLCSPGDPSTAGGALQAVAGVNYVPMYGDGVVCKINGVPSNQTCQRMPPASAYWAFFHASRGGSWTYSSAGVADYNPAPGSVIGFAFGSGGAPSSPPPGASAPAPTPTPSPSSSSSRPPAPKPTPKPVGTTPARPPSSSTSAGSTSVAGTSSAAGSSVTRPAAAPSTTALGSTTAPSPTDGATSGTTPAGDATSAGGSAAAAQPESTDSGSPTTLLAGLGLVGLVGAGAAYLAIRRRATG